MNSFGFCNLSIVPCRKDASDKSEMVTQFLFGEYFEILEEYKSWLLVRSGIDSYQGWIDKKQCATISKDTFLLLKKGPATYTADIVGVLTDLTADISFPVTTGCILPFLKGKEFTIEKRKYQYQGNTITPSGKIKRPEIVEDAFTFLNAPYLWGGRTPLGIDCSGFVQMIYRLNGMLLPRDASQQVELGEALSFPEEAKAGDLAFFDNAEGRITHVGIILDDMQIIHASGKVHVDKLDHLGIYSEEKNGYTHNLRVLKKMF
ncbi:MAG TPA: C40 family peptidase [Bacteroidia bacterium]|nr:C40 family peptidase [Bacteroidia bacterium]